MATSEPLQEPPDFSLVLGGPTFQMFRRSHLSGDALELLYRRVVAIVLVAWVPLLLLSVVGNYFLAGTPKLSFLHDIEAHVRLLVALPVLIAAELIVHLRLRPVVGAFLARRIVQQRDQPRYLAAIDSAMRLRNSVPVELGLAVLVLTVGQWLWRSQIALGASTWYAIPQDGHMHLTAAGYWYDYVSIPIFQFILLRWYLRLFIWFRFLWQVSRLDLHLIPTHPDRAGGLAFLGKSSYAFGPILFAQGALLSGVIASRILYGGESLQSFRVEVVGFIGFFLVVILAPLTMFTPQMARAKRKGLAEYGLLANRYVERFEQKWVVGNAAEGAELLGTGDIQSLADMGNSYSAVKQMRTVPIGREDIGRLAAASAAPLLPLGLTVFSLQDLVVRIFKLLF
ncbi:MAG: hypothetical protein WCA37_01690 [Terracidiphilus sp.]